LKVKKVEHLGIAVPNLEEAARFYQQALGLPLEGVENIEGQKVRVGFFPVGESRIELVEPAAPDSPISKFLEKKGAGLHHICLEVEDLNAALEELKAKGVRLIDSEPRPGAHGYNIAFVHPQSASGVLLELTEKQKSSQ
jgi:methylmalonyl-CoA epimerase